MALQYSVIFNCRIFKSIFKISQPFWSFVAPVVIKCNIKSLVFVRFLFCLKERLFWLLLLLLSHLWGQWFQTSQLSTKLKTCLLPGGNDISDHDNISSYTPVLYKATILTDKKDTRSDPNWPPLGKPILAHMWLVPWTAASRQHDNCFYLHPNTFFFQSPPFLTCDASVPKIEHGLNWAHYLKFFAVVLWDPKSSEKQVSCVLCDAHSITGVTTYMWV